MTAITCSIKDIIWATPDIMKLTCVPAEPYAFRAGQYALLQTHDMPEPRAYSIAAPENSQELIFHIRKADNSPTTQSFMELRPGDTIRVSTARGGNILDTSRSAPLVLIAGGVGIAPLYAIMMTAYKHHPERNIALYWGGDTEKDLYLHDHLLDLTKTKPDFTYTPVCLTPQPNMAKGRVTDHILHNTTALQDAIIHIAGPKQMMQHTLKILGAQGIPEHSVSYDKFW